MAEPAPRPLLTPGRVRELLARHELRPSKALGQHYLADPNTARKVARLGGIEPGETVLEVGPGLGSLTLFAIGNRDYALLQGTILLFSLLFTLTNLIVDLLYGYLDQRIRYE